MTADALLEVLQHHPFAEELSPRHLERLGAMAKHARFETDQVIFREGDECSTFYLIASGRVALEIVAPGRIFRVQTLEAGDELGWSAMLMRSGKHFQARALEPVNALAFEGSELLHVSKEDPELGFALMYRMLGVVAERLQATRLQLLDIYSPKSKKPGAPTVSGKN